VTFIKFCGMTREADVTAAVEAGVHAVGFVLWPGSPRCVDHTRAAVLIATLPLDVTPVGVFVRPTRDAVSRGLDAGIRVVQIHDASGDTREPFERELWLAASLSDTGISPAVPEGVTVLLDADDPQRVGGTGRTIDWTRAAHVAAQRRVILAGGLRPTNVAQAVRVVRPFGVDVASGIEDDPGIKNVHLMQQFVAAVREAER
jgi:phosphoribosylanthranilate isomerase